MLFLNTALFIIINGFFSKSSGEKNFFRRNSPHCTLDGAISLEVKVQILLDRWSILRYSFAYEVLRLLFNLQGEQVQSANPNFGLLHRGIEKLKENNTFLQALPYMNRLDYVSMLVNEHLFALAEEKNYLPFRTQYLRTLFDEITRILSHLMAGTIHAAHKRDFIPFFPRVEELKSRKNFFFPGIIAFNINNLPAPEDNLLVFFFICFLAFFIVSFFAEKREAANEHEYIFDIHPRNYRSLPWFSLPFVAAFAISLFFINFVFHFDGIDWPLLHFPSKFFLNLAKSSFFYFFSIAFFWFALVNLTLISFSWFFSILYDFGKSLYSHSIAALILRAAIAAAVWFFLVAQIIFFVSFFWRHFYFWTPWSHWIALGYIIILHLPSSTFAPLLLINFSLFFFGLCAVSLYHNTFFSKKHTSNMFRYFANAILNSFFFRCIFMPPLDNPYLLLYLVPIYILYAMAPF